MTVYQNKKPRQNLLLRHLPIFEWLPQYQRTWLRSDLIAGLTVVALLIPEGMAYAQIAGMPLPPPAAAPAVTEVDLTAKLQQLADLHSAGILTDEEFAAAKQKLLAG